MSTRGPVQSVDEKTNLQAQAVAVGGDLSVVKYIGCGGGRITASKWAVGSGQNRSRSCGKFLETGGLS